MFKIDSSRVWDLLAERKLTLQEFAREAGINAVTARKILSCGKVNTKIVAKLAAFFGVGGSSLILKAD